jgi:hypothetical protein
MDNGIKKGNIFKLVLCEELLWEWLHKTSGEIVESSGKESSGPTGALVHLYNSWPPLSPSPPCSLLFQSL